MIKRYQNNNNSPVRLHRQIDPCNQCLLRHRYDLSFELEFFAWIEDSLGSYHIMTLSDDQLYVDRWRKSSIQFFFWLDQDKQNLLINKILMLGVGIRYND